MAWIFWTPSCLDHLKTRLPLNWNIYFLSTLRVEFKKHGLVGYAGHSQFGQYTTQRSTVGIQILDLSSDQIVKVCLNVVWPNILMLSEYRTNSLVFGHFLYQFCPKTSELRSFVQMSFDYRTRFQMVVGLSNKCSGWASRSIYGEYQLLRWDTVTKQMSQTLNSVID